MTISKEKSNNRHGLSWEKVKKKFKENLKKNKKTKQSDSTQYNLKSSDSGFDSVEKHI